MFLRASTCCLVQRLDPLALAAANVLVDTLRLTTRALSISNSLCSYEIWVAHITMLRLLREPRSKKHDALEPKQLLYSHQ